MLKGKKILLAEDDSYVRKFIVTLLQYQGCTVFESANGKEAVDTCFHNEIDCAVIDLKMPEMDGAAFVAYNYENSFLPVVICTGRADSYTALNLLKYGVQDYVLKPFKDEQLVTTLSRVLARGNIKRGGALGQIGLNWSVGSISIPSLKTEIIKAGDWVNKKLEKIVGKKELDRFSHFLFELIFNAFEHGSLNISEEKKSRLLCDETYENEISRREKECRKKIYVELSVIRKEVAVKITDEGSGFSFEDYLEMRVGDLVNRMEFPNGRGIYMAKSYFDEIKYGSGGREVTVKKSF